jgi:hypothetical protein
MDFIWEGLPNPVIENFGKCSSAKEIWDKLHDIYYSLYKVLHPSYGLALRVLSCM